MSQNIMSYFSVCHFILISSNISLLCIHWSANTFFQIIPEDFYKFFQHGNQQFQDYKEENIQIDCPGISKMNNYTFISVHLIVYSILSILSFLPFCTFR